ncbi:hypothetical protein REPUB_Repub14bG0088300 [Reevesia pubescens]
MERSGLRGRGTGGYRGGGSGRGRNDGGDNQQPNQHGHVHVDPSGSHDRSTSGRVWGAGSGARTFAQVLSSPLHSSSTSPANDASDPVIPAMGSLKISEPSSSSSPKTVEILLPMKRPDDNCGTNSDREKLSLRVNHFPVEFDAEKIILHYDVDVKPKVASRNGHPVKVSKSDLSLIRTQMSLNNPKQIPLEMTAYDGKKSIFSAVELTAGEYTVQVSESSYLVTLKLVNMLRLSHLNDYLSGKGSSVPRDILQGMDLVMKENPKKRMSPEEDLGHGIIAFRKPKHSLKLTSQGLALCLDYSVLPVPKLVPVIEYLGERIDGFNINKFGSFKDKVELALKGLKVYKTHIDFNRGHTITGLTSENTRDISFCNEDEEVRLVDYFKEKYGKDIMYKDIPCLELGKKNGSHYVPMELCRLAEEQRCPKELLHRDVARKLKNLSLLSPVDRQNKIYKMLRDKDGPFCGEVLQNFGMKVSMNMTEVSLRVLSPPELNVGVPGGRKMKMKLDKEKCHWNLVDRCVVVAKQINCWAVLNFTSGERDEHKRRTDHFISKLISRCNKLGIQMREPFSRQMAKMDDLNREDELQKALENVRLSCEERKMRLQLLLCVMAREHSGYGCLKFISETKVGVMTQCCLSAFANEAKDHYLANLALKINAKLGGHNVEIIEPFLHFKGEGAVMFVGADVNHPGFRNSTSPSIAAVVASMSWPAPNNYAARIRPQDPRSEKIQDFGEMCLELIDSHVKLNKKKPAKIMIFRDGVSETQFDMVLNEELFGLRRAFKAMNYFPTITVIVAQKRHNTRFFPKTKEAGSSSGNVPPGTVIDSTVVDLSGFHFHLCSQYGSMGTSKSTQYHVLYDENGFTSDHIQQLIHSMCFTFARCTKSVSLIPPVYYADLAAYRGRLYQEVLDRQSQPSQPSAAALDKNSYRVHPDLQNSMFFI